MSDYSMLESLERLETALIDWIILHNTEEEKVVIEAKVKNIMKAIIDGILHTEFHSRPRFLTLANELPALNLTPTLLLALIELKTPFEKFDVIEPHRVRFSFPVTIQGQYLASFIYEITKNTEMDLRLKDLSNAVAFLNHAQNKSVLCWHIYKSLSAKSIAQVQIKCAEKEFNFVCNALLALTLEDLDQEAKPLPSMVLRAFMWEETRLRLLLAERELRQYNQSNPRSKSLFSSSVSSDEETSGSDDDLATPLFKM